MAYQFSTIFYIMNFAAVDGTYSSESNGKRSPEENGSSGKSKSWYRSNKLLKPFELGKQADEEGQRKANKKENQKKRMDVEAEIPEVPKITDDMLRTKDRRRLRMTSSGAL